MEIFLYLIVIDSSKFSMSQVKKILLFCQINMEKHFFGRGKDRKINFDNIKKLIA